MWIRDHVGEGRVAACSIWLKSTSYESSAFILFFFQKSTCPLHGVVIWLHVYQLKSCVLLLRDCVRSTSQSSEGHLIECTTWHRFVRCSGKRFVERWQSLADKYSRPVYLIHQDVIVYIDVKGIADFRLMSISSETGCFTYTYTAEGGN